MPICEADPWRVQYFEGVPCPEDVKIPTEDGDAYIWYPKHRWIYNKLMVAESQGLVSAPHGIDPPEFPIFSKPIFNMRGMGAGSRIFRTLKEYKYGQRPGHMWMTLLNGEHVSSDVAIVDGKARWWRHSTGIPLGEGVFDYWLVEAAPRPELEAYCSKWVEENLSGYTGMANFETIGGTIIEAHLRFADQWPDLYGEGWVEALVSLYEDGDWFFRNDETRNGYSVVLFGAHGIQYRHPPQDLVSELLQAPQVTSIQITFHEDRPPGAHSMPPGGFRLAIVNGWDLEVARKVREKLALSFWSTQQLLQRRKRRDASASPSSD
ncbi:MAG: hypothetical protein R3245_13110 [Kiloniellales bacterium]|nr:hypothetical protein [Kiloniellales bacterium]